MPKTCLVYTNDECLDIVNTVSHFKTVDCSNNLSDLTQEYKVLIVQNIIITRAVKEHLIKSPIQTKFLIQESLDSVSVENIDSLFDDIFIGATSDGLVRYLSYVLRGLYA